MKQFKKLLTLISLGLLLTLMFTGLASADVLRGEGWLYANGSGFAKLGLNGTVDITSHGVGTVYIYGADEIEASGLGRRVNRAGGAVVFYGHSGEIYAAGERMVVKMIGHNIEFTAEGKGAAVLRGRGVYETGNGYTGDWAPDGLDVELEEE